MLAIPEILFCTEITNLGLAPVQVLQRLRELLHPLKVTVYHCTSVSITPDKKVYLKCGWCRPMGWVPAMNIREEVNWPEALVILVFLTAGAV